MTMNKPIAVTVAAAAAFALSPPAAAADAAGFFSKGQTSFVIGGGTGYAFNQSYFVLGLGVNYYVIDGFNVGLSVESWTGADPNLYKVTPSVQYVFHQIPKISPYIGAFYRLFSIGCNFYFQMQLSAHFFRKIGAMVSGWAENGDRRQFPDGSECF